MSREEKIKKINSFISMCKTKKGEYIPEGYNYSNVTKVVSERYATQNVEVVKVFISSEGKKGNNTPYIFPEELPVGTATMVSDDLFDIRTTNSIGYGTIASLKKKIVNIDPDLLSPDYD